MVHDDINGTLCAHVLTLLFCAQCTHITQVLNDHHHLPLEINSPRKALAQRYPSRDRNPFFNKTKIFFLIKNNMIQYGYPKNLSSL